MFENVIIFSYVVSVIVTILFTIFKSKDTEGIIILWISTILIGWILGTIEFLLLLIFLIHSYVEYRKNKKISK